ncbi:recombinase family protein [Pararhizobium sp. IMCC21322]|uniref:recombinase family protein n=1 Tax=Pararhizobium sp. IMCC21322 TaxID=3067903 RepID=UPI002740415A|nr:recombinase family protein [Pararhizobium sp. IMCC21322]
MRIGYARVSTVDQNPNAQRDALKAAGCEKVVTEKVSGASLKRPKLEKLLRSLDAGDVLTVWRLDRVGRSLPHLLQVVADLKVRNIGFQSLNETIDTTTANGELIFHLFASMAQFERSLIVERTQAGLVAAKKRGVRLGRPSALTAAQIKHARKLIESGERPSAVAETLEVDRSTLYRYLKGEVSA